MDIELQTRYVAMHPEWRALIDERLQRLADRFPRLVRVHLTLRHAPHHVHGLEEVDVVASYPGTTLRAAKREADMRAALHAALDAIERELVAHRKARRRPARPLRPRAERGVRVGQAPGAP